MRRMLMCRLRIWLIKMLAGRMEVAINLKIVDGALEISQGPGVVVGCTFIGKGMKIVDEDVGRDIYDSQGN